MSNLRKKALSGLVWELAEDNLGVYPSAVSGGTNPYEKRSDWQEGWNACASALIDSAGKIEDWLKSLPIELKAQVEDLLLEGRLMLHCREAKITLTVNCSDTFYWGCADCEDIDFEDLSALVDCYALSPRFGGELWVSRKRGMRPQAASYKECYPTGEWLWFDAAGPERTDPDGAGRRTLTHAAAEEYRERRRATTQATATASALAVNAESHGAVSA